MPSDKSYLQRILEQLASCEDVTYKAMMGEYILYYRGKIIGGIYDNLTSKTQPILLDCWRPCMMHYRNPKRKSNQNHNIKKDS